MSTEARDFDKEAAGRDEHPTRVQLAQDVASAIAREVPLGPTMDVLDFGCGTGIGTLQLAASVGTVTGVDSSQGMLDVLKAKIDRQVCTNVTTRRLNRGAGLSAVRQGAPPAERGGDTEEIVRGRSRQRQMPPGRRMSQPQLDASEQQAIASEQMREESVVAALAIGRIADHGM
jgi:Methyltransferase domain